MSTPNGRPDALELIEAVREFLDDEVKDAVHGQLRSTYGSPPMRWPFRYVS